MKLNLALYKRAMLTDSRKFALYGAWLAMGGFLFLQLNTYVSIMTSMRAFRGAGGGMNGLQFLATLAYTNFFFVTLAGIMGFSSSITEEKEEDCLGLLIMTGISPFNLLASKMLARYSRGFFLLLSQVPFIIMAVTLGGVSLNQVIAAYSVLLSYMFLLCCLGNLISLIFDTSKRASTVMFVCLAAYPLSLLLLVEADLMSEFTATDLLPFTSMNMIFSTGFTEYFIPGQFFGSIICGLVFFFLSVKLFDRFALKVPSENKSKGKVKFSLFKKSRPWSNALFWKEFTFNLSGRKGWVVQCLIYIFLTSILSYYMSPYDREEALTVFLAFASLVFSTLILAVSSASMFSSEFRDGTHTSLFTLPIELSSIFWSKLMGGILYALPSILLSMCLFLYVFTDRAPDFEWILASLSFVLVFIVLSGYLGLVMRVGSFVAAGAIIFLGWVTFGSIAFRGMGEEEAAFVMVFLNGTASIAFFFLGRNKLQSMISR
ncbi:MAG: ABC transporter permease [Lentisphaeraceae bacterium]|nr:ABC transporter permease [Lentisphaeraceae bacterium]